MNNKTYDTLKTIALVFAPIATFAAALTTIWNIPFGNQITASLAALDTLLGALVVISKKIYDDKNKKEGGDNE